MNVFSIFGFDLVHFQSFKELRNLSDYLPAILPTSKVSNVFINYNQIVIDDETAESALTSRQSELDKHEYRDGK